MAVDDQLHGHGLGTILLERLALLAIDRASRKLWAITHARQSGNAKCLPHPVSP